LLFIVLEGCFSDQYTSEYDYDEYNEVGEEVTEDDDYVEYKEDAVTSIPQFLSQSKHLAVDSGETFSLPCFVSKMDDFVLMWMKDGKIISLGNKIIKSEGDRYMLEVNEQGNKLVVHYAIPEDRGNYRCQVSSYNLAYIDHTVAVRVEPVIETYPKGQVFLREGDSVQLLCYLYAGEPQPEIYWMIRNTENDTEHLEQQLDLTNVTRHHSGQYICIADNGFGLKPVSREVTVSVQYAPEIGIEQVYLSSSKGSYIIISCTVKSSPRARVTWAKDGQRILPDWPDQDEYDLRVDQDKHNLLLKTITADSFGVYTCSAVNRIGASQASTDVTGHGCWTTHKHEQLSKADMKQLTDNENIKPEHIQYGVVCRQPFTDFLVEKVPTKDENKNTEVDTFTASSHKHIDESIKEKQTHLTTRTNIEQIESATSGGIEDDAIKNSFYSHESINDKDEVKLHTLAEDVDPKEFIDQSENKNDDSQILSIESRTETVEILLPPNKIKAPRKEEAIDDNEAQEKEDEHGGQMNFTETNINGKVDISDINNEKERIGEKTEVVATERSKFTHASASNGADAIDKTYKIIEKTEKDEEPSKKIGINASSDVMPKNESEFDLPLTTKGKIGDVSSTVINEASLSKNAKVITHEDNMNDIGQLVYKFENQTNDKYESAHSNSITAKVEDKSEKQTETKSKTLPHISNNITGRKEEPVRNIRTLIKKYKSIKMEECQLSQNVVIENTNTIRMTPRDTATDCHTDCQLTEGCLGWFLGVVGGVKSCVLYGCGEFRKISQQNTVSCRIGDCIDGWLEELYSCKFKDFYGSVGEERFERIVQAQGGASQLSCLSLFFMLLWIPLFTL